jgi:midasin (ATPase involved in ribosome maturation)
MIGFNVDVHHHTTSVFATAGRPWEFNLRDIFRWCELMRQHQGTLSD